MVADIQIVHGEFYCTDGFHSYCFSDNCNDSCGFNKKTFERCAGYRSRSRQQDDGTMLIDEGCVYCAYREIYKGFQAKYYEITTHFDQWQGYWYATVSTRGKIYNRCTEVKIDGVTVFGGDSDAPD